MGDRGSEGQRKWEKSKRGIEEVRERGSEGKRKWGNEEFRERGR